MAFPTKGPPTELPLQGEADERVKESSALLKLFCHVTSEPVWITICGDES